MFLLSAILLVTAIVRIDSRSIHGTNADSTSPTKAATLKAFEAKFLDLVGMKEKDARTSGRAVVPQYMLDLYDNHVRDPDYISTNMVFKDFATTANTVRSFYHKDSPHGNGEASRSRRGVQFDMSSVPSHEEIVRAEFRVYNNRSLDERNVESKHVLKLYHILASGERQLLDSKIVNSSTVGWQSYDILHAVKAWQKTPRDNRGLELEITSEDGRPMDISHLHFDKPQYMDEEHWPHRRPLFAVFSRDPATHLHKKRERRSSATKPRWSTYSGLCRRFDLVIDFNKHLNWKWVIRPTQYHAYLCKGECRYPIPNHLNTTNHAIVQTLVHSFPKYRQRVPPACCVPTELDSLIILIEKGKDDYELKSFRDMSVSSCGCR